MHINNLKRETYGRIPYTYKQEWAASFTREWHKFGRNVNRPSQVSGVQGIAWLPDPDENANQLKRARGSTRDSGEQKVLKPFVIFSFLAVVMCLAIGIRGNNLAVASPAVEEKATKSDVRSANAVQAEMRNVMYHFSDNIVAHIRTLSGELEPTEGKDMPVF